MSEPFIGEVKVISFNFPPRGWAFCNGQTLPISQNQALFAILGTTYGGDGISTFMLPNLQGRMPIHAGRGYSIGNVGGETSHTLTINEMPAHNHPAMAQSVASNPGSNPASSVWAAYTQPLFNNTANTTMSPSAVGNAGANLPHQNLPPYLVLNYVIALVGIFPSRP